MLASGNAHKAVELARVLPGWDVRPFGGGLPEETGETFVENALLKARHVHAAIGGAGWVLADDSGIEAARAGRGARRALGPLRRRGRDRRGEPEKLLAALEGQEDRRVRYVAELVAIAPGGAELHARGELTGTLAAEPRGDGGFGYDPAFVPDGETRTVAEMAPGRRTRCRTAPAPPPRCAPSCPA